MRMEMKILDARRMTELDKRAQEEFGIPSIVLMENAGTKACALLEESVFNASFPPGLLLFIAGKGNNGGDALVMAREYLVRGCPSVTVILAAGEPPQGGDPAVNLAICRKLSIPVMDFTQEPEKVLETIHRSSWIFDGIAGTGINGELKSSLFPLVDAINNSPAGVIAIDVPSGTGDQYKKGYKAIKADHTVSMGLPKLSLYLPDARLLCGTIHVVRLGFPPSLISDPRISGELITDSELPRLNPPLPGDTYKSRRGHLAVFAGSRGTTGAAFLSATAAGRCRTGLVTLMADKEIYPLMVPRFSSLMIREWDPTEENCDTGKFSAFLIGPGWGISRERKKMLKRLLAKGLPCVLDADALTLLAEISREENVDLKGQAVLTPHAGEFCRFTGSTTEELLSDPLPPLLKLSTRLNGTIVLKSHITYIAFPDGRFRIRDGVNPALGTGGSGDVLAGLIGGFLAAGHSPEEAAVKGVLVHSLAGSRAYETEGWFLAEDLLPDISRILKN